MKCDICDGSGIVTGTGIEPECCMRFDRYGGCCNSPIAVQIPTPEQCGKCQATGQIEPPK